MNEHAGHRSRMKQQFLQQGLGGLPDHAVLELLLFYAQPRRDTNPVAHRLLEAFGSLDAVFEAPPEALMQVEGVGESAAVLIHLVPEAARRYRIAKESPGTVLGTSADVGRFILPRFHNSRSEELYLICLDPRNRVLDCRRISSGGPTDLAFNLRTIVETALLHNAASVIIAHNHPDGFAIPSPEDRSSTRLVRDTLAAVHITLLDHIVAAGNDFVSMSDSGMLD